MLFIVTHTHLIFYCLIAFSVFLQFFFSSQFFHNAFGSIYFICSLNTHFCHRQIGVTYNVDKAPTDNSFEIIVQVIKSDKNKIEARSCVKYVGDGQKSGMAILEFGLPSGFNVDQDDVNEVQESDL